MNQLDAILKLKHSANGSDDNFTTMGNGYSFTWNQNDNVWEGSFSLILDVEPAVDQYTDYDKFAYYDTLTSSKDGDLAHPEFNHKFEFQENATAGLKANEIIASIYAHNPDTYASNYSAEGHYNVFFSDVANVLLTDVTANNTGANIVVGMLDKNFPLGKGSAFTYQGSSAVGDPSISDMWENQEFYEAFIGSYSNYNDLATQTDLNNAIAALNAEMSPDNRAGDIFFREGYDGTLYDWTTIAKGNYGYYTVLHEMGHSLGLNHAHDVYKNQDGVNEGYLNNAKFSIMSYNINKVGDSNTTYIADGFDGNILPYTLQLIDIAAIQDIYGKNYDTRSGDDVYEAGRGFMDKDKAFTYTIWDGNGDDEINASAYEQSAQIDLRQGRFSSIGKNASGNHWNFDAPSGDTDYGNVAIAYYAIIENAVGTDLNDILIGNAWNNKLYGGDSNDHIYGDGYMYDGNDGFLGYELTSGNSIYAFDLSGNDELYGEAGNDTLYGGKGADKLYGGLNNDYLFGGYGNDDLDGSDGVDELYGEQGNDNIFAGEGNDIIEGGLGNDILHGGTDDDTYIYTLGDGNDVIYEIDGGADKLELYKIYSYMVSLSESGNHALITIDSADLIDDETITIQDQLLTATANIEEITLYDFIGNATARIHLGSNTNDTISAIAGSVPALIHGYGGADSINGSGYNDDIMGGDGDDVISGNAGNDYIYGQDDADTLNGNAGYDRLYGGDGGDTLDGGIDFDTLYGDAGDDVLIGGTGGDTLFGGVGFDNAFYHTETGTQDINANFNTSLRDRIEVRDSYGDLDTLYDVEFMNVGAHDLNIEADYLLNNSSYYITANGYYFGFYATSDVNFDLYDYHSGGFVRGIDIDTAYADYSAANGITFNSYLNYTTASDGVNVDTLTPDATGIDLYGQMILGSNNGATYNHYNSSSVLYLTGNGADNINLYQTITSSKVFYGGGNDTIFLDNVLGHQALEVYAEIYAKNSEISSSDILGYSFTDTASNQYISEIEYIGTATITTTQGTITFQNVERVVEIDENENPVNTTGDSGRFIFDGGTKALNISTGEITSISAGMLSVYTGSVGNDTFDFSSSSYSNPIYTFSGNDTVTLGALSGVLNTGWGDDVVNGSSAADTINAEEGNDTIQSGAGNDIVDAGGGDDDIDLGENNDNLIAGAGNDTILTGNGDDIVEAGDGNDTVNVGYTSFTGNKIIHGNRGNDVLYGGAGNDEIHGGDGNDYINGFGGSNDIYGDGGDDQIFAGAGGGTLYGGDGNDSIEGAGNSDVIYGDAGEDIINGHDGDDIIEGGSDDDVIDGGAGNDTISGGDGDDIINTGNGVDTVFGGDGNDIINRNNISTYGGKTIYGGNGNDELHGGISGDILYGNAGNDIFYGYAYWNTYYGGSGNDIFYAGETGDYIYGENGNDVGYGYDISELDGVIIYGINANNSITDEFYGGEGNDVFYAGGGNDYLYGGTATVADSGDDLLDGGEGNDYINGGNGYNKLFTGNGIDTVHGGSGTDEVNLNDNTANGKKYIYTYDGDDFIYGGTADDEIYAGAGIDTIYAGDDGDYVLGGNDADTIHGQAGNDVLHGESGQDSIYGGIGNDYLYGGDDMDNLHGQEGDDIISGGSGNDNIYGGVGNNTLTGDAGADIFYFRHEGDSFDTVTDFTFADSDVLDLSSVLQYDSGSQHDIYQFLGIGVNSAYNTDIYIRADGAGGWYHVANITSTDAMPYTTLLEAISAGTIVVE